MKPSRLAQEVLHADTDPHGRTGEGLDAGEAAHIKAWGMSPLGRGSLCLAQAGLVQTAMCCGRSSHGGLDGRSHEGAGDIVQHAKASLG
jgi:hypothetical protein